VARLSAARAHTRILFSLLSLTPILPRPPTGKVNFQLPEGSVLSPGQLIARLDLDDPAAVRRWVGCSILGLGKAAVEEKWGCMRPGVVPAPGEQYP